jgi:hypothetical protein
VSGTTKKTDGDRSVSEKLSFTFTFLLGGPVHKFNKICLTEQRSFTSVPHPLRCLLISRWHCYALSDPKPETYALFWILLVLAV